MKISYTCKKSSVCFASAGGWFAKDLPTLQRVGKVALQPKGTSRSIEKLLIPTDAVEQADEAVQAAFRQVI